MYRHIIHPKRGSTLMKTLIILTISAAFLILNSPAAAKPKNIHKTLNIHKSGKTDYVDSNLGYTLNLYKKSSTSSLERNLYLPLDIKVTTTKTLSIKERRNIKKADFFKKRRVRKYKRILKKMNFFKDRRRNKFQNKIYLWKWYRNNQNKISREETS